MHVRFAGRGQDGQDTTQVTYTSVGTNTITVTASSPLQTVSASITIDVIEAVVESSLSITVDSATSIWTYPGTWRSVLYQVYYGSCQYK